MEFPWKNPPKMERSKPLGFESFAQAYENARKIPPSGKTTGNDSILTNLQVLGPGDWYKNPVPVL